MLFSFIFINFICIDLILYFVFKYILEIKEKILEDYINIVDYIKENSVNIALLDSDIIELKEEIKNMKNTKESEE